MHSIVVIGSSNTDMVIRADHLPVPGETILGGSFLLNPGGKGANQAVAAARLGGKVVFICKTGNDIFGKQAAELFKKEGIDVSLVFSDADHPSGVALITVDKKGENSIVVAPGSNGQLLPKDLSKASQAIGKAGYLLLQLEIPLETVEYAVSVASAKKVKIILNPAPARSLPDALLGKVNIITPNETEAEVLTGIKVVDNASAEEAAKVLHQKGVETVIITRGAEGACVSHGNAFYVIPATTVRAVDTTAAGDVFNGALVVALAGGMDFKQATTLACRAASISVTRLGAQSSAPYLHEINS